MLVFKKKKKKHKTSLLKNANHHLNLQQVIICLLVEESKYFENYQNVTQRHKVSKCCWKDGTNRLAQHRAATDLQFVKNTISVKRNKAKYAYNHKNTYFPLFHSLPFPIHPAY